ncbi:MAG TPA: FAD-linked oxidase C-terminal domain-containing protein [Vicinamibacterales bacterium]|nr:FAD-linked oxidase C-terminal domain-containing protein [Vicinamibacterales bacterium]
MSTLPSGFSSRVAEIVGGPFVLQDASSLDTYGADALKQGSAPDIVALPGSTQDVSALATLCNEERVPIVVRGGGTGYTGGAVPIHGGLVMSLERLNRILEIDRLNLLARVQPNVITGDLQDAVERVGLFYPPDPASLRQSAIGGNVAECAGGPRAFKYGTTKRYVLALEAVLPTGEIIHTGSKAVKNVVGYDLTQLLVGSEGTLAIITEVTLRLIPKPPARATLLAEFADIPHAADGVTKLIERSVVPGALEIVDAESLNALAAHAGRPMASPGTGAVLIVEVDGAVEAVGPELALVEDACRAAGAIKVRRAGTEAEREEIWHLRRELSAALRKISTVKLNNDVVVPRGRVPELFALVRQIQEAYRLPMASFGHAGDGNIHVNIMPPAGDAEAMGRARAAERALFEGVVALEGSISGEHGIGITKSKYLGLELSADEIALMKRVKAAFDPSGILNPGKIFPDE